MWKKFIPILIASFLLSSTHSLNTNAQETTTKDINEQTVQAILWMHSAAEYKALCYQAYNLARLELDNALSKKAKNNKPFAIITDCDNTILNDLPAQTYYIGKEISFNLATWTSFVDKAQFKPIPGAVDFFNYAASKGVEIFYIPNRIEDTEFNGTLKNLKACGFPMADRKHLLLKTNSSNKQLRYDQVTNDYDVLIYLGDNLGDMPIGTYHKSYLDRNKIVEDKKHLFGTKFIVLPNPVYGDWESSLIDGYYKLSPSEKDKIKKMILQSE